MRHGLFVLVLTGFAMLLAACGASGPPTLDEQDRVATRVAEEQAVAATLTASAGGAVTDPAPTEPGPAPAPSETPDLGEPQNEPQASPTVPQAEAPAPETVPPQFADIVFVPAPENRRFGGGVILPGSTHGTLDNPVFGNQLVAGVIAYFPPDANQNGTGITSVIFRVEDPQGNEVYEHEELQAGYCLFGGGTPNCDVYSFSANNCRWPGGATVTSGQHRGRAQLNGQSESEEWRFNFQIDLSGTSCAAQNGGQNGGQVPRFADIPFFPDPESRTVGGGMQASIVGFQDDTPVVTDPLVVRAVAYLPKEQNADGSPIVSLDGRGLNGGNVTFTVFSPGGQVYQRTEMSVPYCLFNGDSTTTCAGYNFAANNCRWPTSNLQGLSSNPVGEGIHSLEITISEAGGPVETWFSSFYLDLPDGSPCGG